MTEIVPPPVLAAIDRLNAHARAYGCGKEAIYEYKSLACKLLLGAGQLSVKPVSIKAKCHNCGGTTQFTYWDGEPGGRCRTCTNGYVNLDFAETTSGAFTWHHPYHRSGRDILKLALDVTGVWVVTLDGVRMLRCERHDLSTFNLGFDAPAGEWKPQRPGEKLIGEEAARLLNLVEAWLCEIPNVPGHLYWDRERAHRAMERYAINVGRVGSAGCHYCDATEVSCGQGRATGLLDWSVNICKAHERMPVEQWDKVCPPSAITPQVEFWLRRRGWKPGDKFERRAA